MRPHARTPEGLRERRKLRTEQDLLRCGLELFVARGYDGTTVGDIAHGAEVSERTFFRYFASKEELVLRPLREANALYLAELERRPPGEEPLRALREAGRGLLHTMACGGTLERYLAALRVMCAEPDVLAAALRVGTQQQREVAAVLRAREGTEPEDPRPSLLAGAFHAAWLVATLAWEERCDGSPQALQTTADSHLGLMPSAVQGRWR
ncbi:TetR/AcrR family transcriptional regulator [Streptomyces sp. 4N509B]|uniref:TetR/AcrR family transcriptional regulator n=1 Tax=Streptomyces sp. 4N509B TaxID=3457413 RepID=UPI003FD464E8